MESLRGPEVVVEALPKFSVWKLLHYKLVKKDPVVLHLHWAHPLLLGSTYFGSLYKSLASLFKILLLKCAGVKVIWTVHNLLDHERTHVALQTRMRKALAVLADKLIVLSDSARERVCEFLQVDCMKTVIVPHGHYRGIYGPPAEQTEAKKQLDLEPDSFVFLHFGTLREYKGTLELIKAFKCQPNPHLRLVIAGQVHVPGFLAQIADAARSDSRIRLSLGRVAAADVPVYFGAADIVALPYSDILVSGVCILAMSFGRAVLAPNIDGFQELLGEDGGVLYGGGTTADLAAGIASASEKDTVSMGKRNAEALKVSDWDQIGARTASIYHALFTLRCQDPGFDNRPEATAE